jgi:hypothetical protein
MDRLFLTEVGWMKEKAVYYQGPLKDTLPIDLPTQPPSAKQGSYEFWFGMEIQRPIGAPVPGINAVPRRESRPAS